MKWSRHKIEIKDIPTFYTQYMAILKKGEANLDLMRCIWKYTNENIVHMDTLFNFLDNYNTINTNGTIQIFYFYQPFNKS